MKPVTNRTMLQTRNLSVFLIGSILALQGHTRSSLDQLASQLSYVSESNDTWAQLSSMNALTVYVPEDPAPGLLFTDDTVFLAPRLSLAVDAGIGQRFLVHALARADRGFDPGSHRDGDLRLDEYYLQVNFQDAGRTQLRIGKFATAFGNWVDRHQSWDNPLITAPLLYEDMVTVTDQAAPAGAADFIGRRDAPANKPGWVPLVWGPSYATGASLTTGTRDVEITLEAKNSALSSRPDTWDAAVDGFATDPTFTGRLGWRPVAAWTVGASASHGPYLQEAAEATLPAGSGLNDFDQTTVGIDVTYELRSLQVWAELARASFDVPRIGTVRALSGFIEARYKLAPRLWLSGRWNQSRFDQPAGLPQSWDRDLKRLDVGLGFRHTTHVATKVEYSVGDQAGSDTNGNQLLAVQVVVWF